jgi:hypothetical protein
MLPHDLALRRICRLHIISIRVIPQYQDGREQLGAMSGSTLFYLAFAAVMVVILLIAGAAVMFEAGPPPPAPGRDTAEPGDEPSQPTGAR